MPTPDNSRRSMATHVKHSLAQASRALGVRDPMPYMGSLIERTFYRPDDDVSYADNRLTPGAVPFEPSFSEAEPDTLRFTIEPLGPVERALDERAHVRHRVAHAERLRGLRQRLLHVRGHGPFGVGGGHVRLLTAGPERRPRDPSRSG